MSNFRLQFQIKKVSSLILNKTTVRTIKLTNLAIMPTGTNQTISQDWGAVNVGRASRPSAKGAKTGVEKRHGSGGNASAHSGGIMSARKVRYVTFTMRSTYPFDEEYE